MQELTHGLIAQVSVVVLEARFGDAYTKSTSSWKSKLLQRNQIAIERE